MNNNKRRSCSEVPPSELDSILSCAHTKRCLLKAGISTLDQLLSLSISDLLNIRGIGSVIAKDIVRVQEQVHSKAGTDQST